MTIEKNLDLDEKLNPGYFSILDKHQILFAKLNKINNDLIAFKVSKLLVWKSSNMLKKIHKEIKIAEKDYLEWNKIATNFIHNPTLNILDNANQNLVFLHNINILSDLRNKLNESFILILLGNHDRAKERQSNQINFIIAIASFVVSLIGLVFALFTFTPHDENKTIDSNFNQGVIQTNPIISDTSHKYQIDSTSMQHSNNKSDTIK